MIAVKRSLDSYRAHRPYVECVEEEGFPSPRRGNDEVARDALLPQSRPGLDLVLAPQVLEGRLGDVDASRERERKEQKSEECYRGEIKSVGLPESDSSTDAED